LVPCRPHRWMHYKRLDDLIDRIERAVGGLG
jgi:hypothetical protein